MKWGDFTVCIWKRVNMRMDHLLKLCSISVKLITKLTYTWKIQLHQAVCLPQIQDMLLQFNAGLSLSSTVIVYTGFPCALATVLLWASPDSNTACISACNFTSSQVHHVSSVHRKLKNTALECSPLAKFCENKSS
jgi:hypothetical protein